MARRLLTLSMTSRDCSWRHSLQSRRIRKLGPASAIRVDSFKRTLKENIMLKHERIPIRPTTAGEETFRATALRPKFGTFSWRKLTVRKVKPR